MLTSQKYIIPSNITKIYYPLILTGSLYVKDRMSLSVIFFLKNIKSKIIIQINKSKDINRDH